jgi:hypothetical protein
MKPPHERLRFRALAKSNAKSIAQSARIPPVAGKKGEKILIKANRRLRERWPALVKGP